MHFTDTLTEELLQIPHHGNRILARPLIREILREIEITVEEYNTLLKK